MHKRGIRTAALSILMIHTFILPSYDKQLVGMYAVSCCTGVVLSAISAYDSIKTNKIYNQACKNTDSLNPRNSVDALQPLALTDPRVSQQCVQYLMALDDQHKAYKQFKVNFQMFGGLVVFAAVSGYGTYTLYKSS